MKKLIFLLTLMVLTLASVSTFAGDVPTFFPEPVNDLSVLCAKDFSSGLPVDATYDETVRIDTGRTLYAEALLRAEPMMEKSVRGAAAGGVCPEEKAGYADERDRIWDELPIFHGGGDVPSLP